MKVFNIFLAMIAINVVLYAGGDTFGQVSSVSSLPLQNCKLNKVYTEKDAELMWQDQVYTDAEDGAYQRNHSVGKVGSWNYATNYCAGLDYQGYDDWRLPTADELSHLHHKAGQPFFYYRGEDFWTSTPTTKNKYYVIYPVDAYRYKRDKNKSHYIRCVRCWVPANKETLIGVIGEGLNQRRERGENNVAELN